MGRIAPQRPLQVALGGAVVPSGSEPGRPLDEQPHVVRIGRERAVQAGGHGGGAAAGAIGRAGGGSGGSSAWIGGGRPARRTSAGVAIVLVSVSDSASSISSAATRARSAADCHRGSRFLITRPPRSRAKTGTARAPGPPAGRAARAPGTGDAPAPPGTAHPTATRRS